MLVEQSGCEGEEWDWAVGLPILSEILCDSREPLKSCGCYQPIRHVSGMGFLDLMLVDTYYLCFLSSYFHS